MKKVMALTTAKKTRDQLQRDKDEKESELVKLQMELVS
jgi:hypothetical protein